MDVLLRIIIIQQLTPHGNRTTMAKKAEFIRGEGLNGKIIENSHNI